MALDPLLTSGMIASGRLARLSPAILRVGGELRPANSTEPGKSLSYLPFRDAVFQRVHCGFMLHLYLEILELLAEEAHRVLRPGGELTVLLPHFGDPASTGIMKRTSRELEEAFGNAEVSLYGGPFTTFWADLYRDKTLQIRCLKSVNS